jgi:hypothetical protein
MCTVLPEVDALAEPVEVILTGLERLTTKDAFGDVRVASVVPDNKPSVVQAKTQRFL